MMRKVINRILVLMPGILAFVLLASGLQDVNDPDEHIDQELIDENRDACLKCHGEVVYSYINEWTDDTVKRVMNPYYRIHPREFYASFHGSFRCTDCHSTDYEVFPHSADLRMDLGYTCLDCHGYDEDFADYHFTKISEEYEKSVHFDKYESRFSCWMCHDPHEYHTVARQTGDVSEIVRYNNGICLSCHNNSEKFLLFRDEMNPPMEEIHGWLPNQQLHFNKVRCLECHTPLVEDLNISHNVLPAELAVRKCVECHSTNSLLMASLYKYENIQARRDVGFFNATILNESYVIGANRNYYLNLFTILVFGLVLLGIVIHIVFRILK